MQHVISKEISCVTFWYINDRQSVTDWLREQSYHDF